MAKGNRKRLRKALRSLDDADVALADLTDDIADMQREVTGAMMDLQPLVTSLSRQCLLIQERVQERNRALNLVSNIMKTKHDTVKSALSNIR